MQKCLTTPECKEKLISRGLRPCMRKSAFCPTVKRVHFIDTLKERVILYQG